MQERQSVNVDIEPSRNTITLNNGADDSIFQALEAPKPERLKLLVGSTGELVGCEYEGYNAHKVIEHIKQSQAAKNDRFLLGVALTALAIVLTAFSSYQLARSWVTSQPVTAQYR